MTPGNLRHLRLFLGVAETGSLSLTAARFGLSQPAVSQAMAALDRATGGPLVARRPQGVTLTPRGAILQNRAARAFARLDPALRALSPRLLRTATSAQLRAFIAVTEAQNFTLAAARLGIAQPTIHRAVRTVEAEAGRPLLDRTPSGLVPSRAAETLARAARLAFAELDQATADMAEADGAEAGRIVIGALPLSRSVLVPQALAAFRAERPALPVRVVDGPYGDMLAGLRRGEIDVIVGALRDPAPIADVTQEALFADSLAIVARPGHPLAGRPLRPDDLAARSWVVPRTGTPARAQFDARFPAPAGITEAGSILFMREYLRLCDHLGCISARQAEAEIAQGLLVRLDVETGWPGREIGLTTRTGWLPTAAQSRLIALLREVASRLGPGV